MDDDFTVDLIVVLVAALVLINRKRRAINRGTLMTIGGATLLDAVVAVFWH
jgi:hypothetical protein